MLNRFGRIARSAAVAGLGLAMVAGPAVTPALAVPAATGGTITINNQVRGNEDSVKYDAYRIFYGTAPTDGASADQLTDIYWANATTRAVALEAIHTVDPTWAPEIGSAGAFSASDSMQSSANRQDAQLFAEKLQQLVQNTNATTIVDAQDETTGGGKFMQNFAYLLANTEGCVLEANDFYPTSDSVDNGYFLVTTDLDSILKTGQDGAGHAGDDPLAFSEQGMAPVFVVVGGQDVTVNEKASVPTITKTVRDKNDDDKLASTWAHAVDIGSGETAFYKVEITLPRNIKAFDSYVLDYTDVIPAGFQYNDDLRVHYYADGAVGANDVAAEGGELVQEYMAGQNNDVASVTEQNDGSWAVQVKAADLRDAHWTDEGVNAASKFVITFSAKLDGKTEEYGSESAKSVVFRDATKQDVAVAGSDGNHDRALLTYSSDPLDGGQTKSTSSVQDSLNGTSVYTSELNVTKQDKWISERKLAQTKFTLQLVSGAADGSTGYVQPDGHVAESAYEFKTAKDGTILIRGLAAGTYVLTETGVPPTTQNGQPYNGNVDDQNGDYYQNPGSVTFTIATASGSGDLASVQVDNQKGAYTMSTNKSDGAEEFHFADTVVTSAANNSFTESTFDSQGSLVANGAGTHGDTGRQNIVVTDVKVISLPLTGAAGTTLFVALGVVSAGLAVAFSRRKSAEEGSED